METEQSSTYLQIDYSYVFGRILPITMALLIIMVLISSAWAEIPSSSVPDVSSYDIPLGELNKVKKERPSKKELKERKKKKGENTVQRPSTDSVVPPEKIDKASATTPDVASKAIPTEPKHHGITEKTSTTASGTSEISQDDPVTIHHDPYSYVIAGKRTAIQAVISSTHNIQAVYCRFRAAENGAYAFVPMVQVPGTHFTYAATLPSLAVSSRSLRYGIIAVDSLGNESRSREFVIAVKSSSVLPGWQFENPKDMIKIRLENKDKPLEGFSDPGIVE